MITEPRGVENRRKKKAALSLNQSGRRLFHHDFYFVAGLELVAGIESIE
jgi:hypothetical protein